MTIHRIRLSKMQKIVNVLAVASAAVSLAVVGTGAFVYVQRDAIWDNVNSQVKDAVLGGLGGLGGGGLPSTDLPLGTNDLAPTTPQASVAPEPPVQF